MAGLAAYFNLDDREWHQPHITLYGPFQLSCGCDPVSILEKGGLFNGTPPSLRAELGRPVVLRGRRGFAVVIRAEPDEPLAELTRCIGELVEPHLASCTWIDSEPGRRIFHISIGFGLHQARALSILETLEKMPSAEPGPDRLCMFSGASAVSHRVEIIRRGALWRAFDLPGGIWLTRGAVFRNGEGIRAPAGFRRHEACQEPNPREK